MTELKVEDQRAGNPPRIGRAGVGKFFVCMSALMLVLIFGGFGRTLYLRYFFEVPSMPLHLWVHGAVLTAWYLLFFVQACLIAKGRRRLHMQLGMAGVILAASVVAVSIWTLVRRDGARIDEFPRAATGNLASLVSFSTCFIWGVLRRDRPAVHKRFMLLASVLILAPALDRLSFVPPFDILFGWLFGSGPIPPNIGAVFFFLFLLILVVMIYDLKSLRRVHSATLWGIACMFVIGPLGGMALTFSNLWSSFVRLVW